MSTRDQRPFALPKDPVIEAYKRDVDRTLIRENLKLTPGQRLRKMVRILEQVQEIRGAARRGGRVGEARTGFEGLLRVLTDAGVEFIVVGGVAAVVHGAARVIYDLDVVYSRRPENLERVVEALRPLNPYPRGAPPGLPFRWGAETLAAGLNFALSTDFADLILFGEVVGGGTYETLRPHSEPVELFGLSCLCLELRKLIEVKRAAGRPKDLEALAELEAILEEVGGS